LRKKFPKEKKTFILAPPEINFSKFYGKVGVIFWLLFHLIWKKSVLVHRYFDPKSWIVDFFTYVSLIKNNPQNNFSRQNFSVEKTTIFALFFHFLAHFVFIFWTFFPPSILFTYCYYFLCYIIVVFALSLYYYSYELFFILLFYCWMHHRSRQNLKKNPPLPPSIWRKNRQLWTLCKKNGYGNWTYTKWITTAILGFLMSKWNFKKKCLPIVKKISPQLLLHSRLKKNQKIEINNKQKNQW